MWSCVGFSLTSSEQGAHSSVSLCSFSALWVFSRVIHEKDVVEVTHFRGDILIRLARCLFVSSGLPDWRPFKPLLFQPHLSSLKLQWHKYEISCYSPSYLYLFLVYYSLCLDWMVSLVLFCGHLIPSPILSILLLSPLTELLNFIYCIFQLETFCLALLYIFYFFAETLYPSAEDFCFSLVSSLLVIVEAFLQWLL